MARPVCRLLTLDKAQTVQPSRIEQFERDDANHELDTNNATKGKKRADKMHGDDIDKLKIANQHNAEHGRNGDNEIDAI